MTYAELEGRKSTEINRNLRQHKSMLNINGLPKVFCIILSMHTQGGERGGKGGMEGEKIKSTTKSSIHCLLLYNTYTEDQARHHQWMQQPTLR